MDGQMEALIAIAGAVSFIIFAMKAGRREGLDLPKIRRLSINPAFRPRRRNHG